MFNNCSRKYHADHVSDRRERSLAQIVPVFFAIFLPSEIILSLLAKVSFQMLLFFLIMFPSCQRNTWQMRRKKLTPWSFGCQAPFKEKPPQGEQEHYQSPPKHIKPQILILLPRRIFCDFLFFFHKDLVKGGKVPSTKMVAVLQDAEGV